MARKDISIPGSSPLSLVFSGNFNPWDGEVYNVGDNGNWWSSTVNNDNNAFNGNVNSNGNVNPANNNDRLNGNSVRCLAPGE